MAAAAARRKSDMTAMGALVGHSLRCRIWTRFAERTASTTELARELREDVPAVSYHVRLLADAGVIEEVSSRRVRGATETFYRATQWPRFDYEGFAALSRAERRAFAEEAFLLAAANFATATETGTLFNRASGHISRVPLRVDEEGWAKLAEIFDRVLEEVLEVKEEAELRLTEDARQPIPVVSFSTFFEMPGR